MGKYKLIAIIIVAIIVVIAIGGLSFLYYSANNQVSVLQTEKQTLQSTNSDLQATNTRLTKENTAFSASESTNVIFADEGQGIRIIYPPSWKGVLTTVVSGSISHTNDLNVVGPILNWYDYNLTNGNSTLTFHRDLSVTGSIRQTLDISQNTYSVISPLVIRYKALGDTKWFYVTKVDCADGSSDVCFIDLFPGFGSGFAATASLIAENDSILPEVDAIVLSAVN